MIYSFELIVKFYRVQKIARNFKLLYWTKIFSEKTTFVFIYFHYFCDILGISTKKPERFPLLCERSGLWGLDLLLASSL